jgi:2-keto-3-deoxy-6-phosphogluconate aldolase
MGSKLISKQRMQDGDYETIATETKKVMEIISSLNHK